MTDLILLFLAGALTLYAVLGGADYGAGIWEAIERKDTVGHRDLVTRAIGPVWEANHVWLIIAVVILFTTYPGLYSQLSTSFHLPLTAILFGITLRGCAFTFRHYDAVQDKRSQRLYTQIFEIASVLTPFLLGTVAGGILLQRYIEPQTSFFAAYVLPWCNLFSFTIGLFCLVLCAFTAAVFLCGETAKREEQQLFAARARWANLCAVGCGLLAFATAPQSGLDLAGPFLAHPLSLACMAGATLAAPVLHWSLARTQWIILPRLLVGVQFGCVLLGAFALHPALPVSTAASAATQEQLLIALGAGSLLLFPALGWLFYVFKRGPATPN